MRNEQQRIVDEFSRRSLEVPAGLYDLALPANRFMHDRYTAAASDLVARAGLGPLGDARVLEIGCGTGPWLRQFQSWGVPAAQLHGIDLYEPRIAEARRHLPDADLRVGDAASLPWDAGTFDVVIQSTVFTSILDAAMRSAVAREMVRVLRRPGAILWYDFMFDNPRNPNVRGIGLREIRALFPSLVMAHRRVTLAPPIARRVVPISETLASVLDAMPFLRTHVVATLTNGAGPGAA